MRLIRPLASSRASTPRRDARRARDSRAVRSCSAFATDAYSIALTAIPERFCIGAVRRLRVPFPRLAIPDGFTELFHAPLLLSRGRAPRPFAGARNAKAAPVFYPWRPAALRRDGQGGIEQCARSDFLPFRFLPDRRLRHSAVTRRAPLRSPCVPRPERVAGNWAALLSRLLAPPLLAQALLAPHYWHRHYYHRYYYHRVYWRRRSPPRSGGVIDGTGITGIALAPWLILPRRRHS